jgi:hypothetical protein
MRVPLEYSQRRARVVSAMQQYNMIGAGGPSVFVLSVTGRASRRAADCFAPQKA